MNHHIRNLIIVFLLSITTPRLFAVEFTFEDYKALSTKLDSIAADANLAHSSQDFLFNIFTTTGDYKQAQSLWFLEPVQSEAIGILGGLARPEKRIILKLASLVNPETSTTNIFLDKLKYPAIMTLGRMGKSAEAALPALRKLSASQRGVGEAMDRISGKVPDSQSVSLGPNDVRIWKGSISRFAKREVYLVQDRKSWNALWGKHAGKSQAPQIDFSDYSILAYFGGEDHSIMELNPIDFEQFASSATIAFEQGHSDAIEAFGSYPYLMVELPKVRVPIAVSMKSWWAMGNGQQNAVIARFEPDGSHSK